MYDIPDAPWIGHCKEEWEEICGFNDDFDNGISDDEYELWKEKQDDRLKDDRRRD